jgi:hypothetical protein
MLEFSRKHKQLINMIAFCLMMHVISGLASQVMPSEGYQHLMWAVSAFFMIIGSSLLSSDLTRHGHDIPAAGFIVLSIAQAMSYGFIATHDAGQEQLGAIIAIFIPGVLLISMYDVIPWFIRIAGFLSAAAFTVLAICIYREIKNDFLLAVLTNVGYMLMNFVTLAWAWLVFKKKI